MFFFISSFPLIIFQQFPPVLRGGDELAQTVLEAAQNHPRDRDPAALGVQGQARLRDGQHLWAGRRRAAGVQGEQKQAAGRHQSIPESTVAGHVDVS